MAFWTKPNLLPKTKSRFIVTFHNGTALKNVKSVTKPSIEVETKEYRLINHYFNYPGLAKWQPITIKFVDMRGSMEGSLVTRNGVGSSEVTDTAKWLWSLLNASGYYNPRSKGSTAISKAGSREALKKIVIQQISPGDRVSPENISKWTEIIEGRRGLKASPGSGQTRIAPGDFRAKPLDVVAMEQWEIINPIIKSIKWGELDYGSDDLVEYTIDLVYDYAIFGEQLVQGGSAASTEIVPVKTATQSAPMAQKIDEADAKSRLNSLQEFMEMRNRMKKNPPTDGNPNTRKNDGATPTANAGEGGPSGRITTPQPCSDLSGVAQIACDAYADDPNTDLTEGFTK
jgi:hypothetical protein